MVRPAKLDKAFNEFAKIVDASRQETRNAFRQVMAELFTAIVTGTPVDTGNARAAWVVQSSNLIGEVYAGGRVSLVQIADKNKPLIFKFSNGANYIVYLEKGSSRQAPKGFVEVNIKKGTNRIRAQIRKLAKKKKKV